jgi:hypothetical protein
MGRLGDEASSVLERFSLFFFRVKEFQSSTFNVQELFIEKRKAVSE